MTDTDALPLLSDAERQQMLADIADAALVLGTFLPPDLDASVGKVRMPASALERLRVLQTVLPALTQCVQQVASAPALSLVRETRMIAPPARARRVSGTALLNAARVGVPLRSVEEIVSVSTPDTPENRAVLRFLNTLHADALAVQLLAARDGEAGIARESLACVRKLRGLLSLPVWGGVTVQKSPAPPTQRMLSTPVYARVWHLQQNYGRALRFDWDAPLFRLPPREAWRVYETWTYFMTARALSTLSFTVPAREQTGFPVRRDRLIVTLQTGQSSRLVFQHRDGRRVVLTFQPTFAAGERSRSRTMQPDIAIESESGSVWILDAKWKSYARPGDELSDINQMHAYRDAIMTREETPAVRRAWCLFPGERGAEGRAVVSYGPPEDSVVGAVRLRPGNRGSLDAFCALLCSWLGT